MSNTNLLPCPCCKSESISIWSAKVRCESCGLSTQECLTKEDAIKRWNKRAPINELLAELKEYQKENENKVNAGFIDVCVDIVKKYT